MSEKERAKMESGDMEKKKKKYVSGKEKMEEVKEAIEIASR